MEVDLTYYALAAFFILAGYLEQMGFRSGHRPWLWVDCNGVSHPRLQIAGFVIPTYHLPLLASWFIVCYLSHTSWFFFFGATIQDWSYWRFHPTARLGETSAVNAKLGGFYVYGDKDSRNNWWLPNIYIIAISLSILSYSL